ncbi:DNA cytosine methyltransferase [Acidithiobacillus sp. MC6.1]|nr:DNA cytosine methyltransferase [Acidithiobacillus sp. MC6.1]
MRYLSLFSGIEAASVAWGPLGFVPVAVAEIDKSASAVLRNRYPDVPNLGDVRVLRDRLLAGEDVLNLLSDPPDIIVGGSPCQSFSIAGARQGLSDHRGNLTLVYAEIVNAINPRYIVWENVSGVLSSKDNAFGHLLGALAGEDGPLVPAGSRPAGLHPAGGKWTNAGAVSGPRHGAGPERNLAWRILDAQYFGVAQRRRRVFLVGSRRDQPGPYPWEILFESEGVRRDSPPRREAGQTIAALAATGVGTCGADDNQAQAGHLISVAFGGNRTGAKGDATLDVSAALSAKNTRMDFESETLLVQSVMGDVAHTLRAEGFDASEDGTGRGCPIIAFDCKAGGNTGFSINENTAGTLRGTGHGGGHAAIAFSSELRVRRLMPVECERLQGFPDFPDGYTEGLADGPRYKCIGNSMAVPVMRWIGRRLVDANE